MRQVQVDHLSAFDLNSSLEIKMAFMPENHQWLTKKDNLSKGATYYLGDLKKFKAEYYNSHSTKESG